MKYERNRGMALPSTHRKNSSPGIAVTGIMNKSQVRRTSPYLLLDGERFAFKPSVPSCHAKERLEKYLKGVNF